MLGDIAGRDVARDPFDSVRTVDRARARSSPTCPSETTGRRSPSSSRTAASNIGYLFVARADGGRYNAQDHALLEGLAAHAGAAFGRAALFGRIRDDYAKTIAALSATLDASEHMPSGHSTRVMDYAMLIGEELGLPFEDVEQLRFAGLLHDIGKTGVPARDPAQAVEAHRRRAAPRAGSRRVRRLDRRPDRVPQVAHARHPAPSRALGRRGLPRRALRRVDSAARAHPCRRRLVRRDEHQEGVRRAQGVLARAQGAPARRGHAVRPARRRGARSAGSTAWRWPAAPGCSRPPSRTAGPSCSRSAAALAAARRGSARIAPRARIRATRLRARRPACPAPATSPRPA